MTHVLWYTRKQCKCGQEIVIEYSKDYFEGIEVRKGGHFRARRFPNYVYCNACARRHDLSRFKRVLDEEVPTYQKII